MRRAFLAGLFALAPLSAVAEPQILILGTAHFANPGLDMLNPNVPDVLAPDRQREIEEVVERLAAFRPTRIVLERDATEQDKLDRAYADYLAGRAEPSKNEITQIGFRLAKRLGLKRVEAVDWQQDLPGDPEAYRFDKWAPANGQGATLEGALATGRKQVAEGDRIMACQTVAGWFRHLNTPAYRTGEQSAYFAIATIGDRKRSPGAWWVGGWYARNLNIMAQIDRNRVTDDDRVLALFGAGHGYLMDRIARESGRFTVVDPLRYLPSARPTAAPGCAAAPTTGGRP